MSKPVKRSIAVLVRHDDLILAVRRPLNDDELPGVWGLPAGTFRNEESAGDLIARIGRDKLGVNLVPVSRLAEGHQERTAYHLEMELWEAQMEGLPSHPECKWESLEVLKPGMSQGSLCCELALGWKPEKGKSRFSS